MIYNYARDDPQKKFTERGGRGVCGLARTVGTKSPRTFDFFRRSERFFEIFDPFLSQIYPKNVTFLTLSPFQDVHKNRLRRTHTKLCDAQNKFPASLGMYDIKDKKRWYMGLVRRKVRERSQRGVWGGARGRVLFANDGEGEGKNFLRSRTFFIDRPLY